MVFLVNLFCTISVFAVHVDDELAVVSVDAHGQVSSMAKSETTSNQTLSQGGCEACDRNGFRHFPCGTLRQDPGRPYSQYNNRDCAGNNNVPTDKIYCCTERDCREENAACLHENRKGNPSFWQYCARIGVKGQRTPAMCAADNRERSHEQRVGLPAVRAAQRQADINRVGAAAADAHVRRMAGAPPPRRAPPSSGPRRWP